MGMVFFVDRNECVFGINCNCSGENEDFVQQIGLLLL